ncbi:TatD family hydrolase [Acinetobacter haemolyticus]|uniref:TatD family hydrolase n=1 Tax=Acinetobacter haemolyticus TaxID=29430 RepID=UPI0021CD30D1|nr:TatD family hydrolase [Acinetobacter haemolyticus]MCU4378887.1 TatD family hydrolase [Acinetobacter haemolyticus]
MQLFDTHTHFDVADFDQDRQQLAVQAKQVGVEALILIGFIESRFDTLIQTHQQLQGWDNVPKSYLAPGLHPFYIEQHHEAHLQQLERILQQHDCVAVGEIGLDTFLKQHKQPELFAKQQYYFNAQLELANQYNKPVLLHIRKAHAESIAILKAQKFKLGGIAHAFSGGIEEAKALVKLGFKIGITGQITNPNAKKLHQVVQAIGVEHLVIETDCPDMTPLCCQTSTEHRTRNTPVNLPYVLEYLAAMLEQSQQVLAQQIWQNSLSTLNIKF